MAGVTADAESDKAAGPDGIFNLTKLAVESMDCFVQ
jgi:hypothetical protein